MIQRDALARMGLFDARLPRYASYPTANQFTTAIEAETVQSWLRALPPSPRLSLHIHVPYCRRLCWFCASRTQAISGNGPLQRYVAGLEAEAAHLAASLPEDAVIGRIHFTGGSPSILPPKLMHRMMRAMRKVARPDPAMSVSMEIDPTDIDPERLDVMAHNGLTDATIGVQDFDPDVQRLVGRAQGFAQTGNLVAQLRARGITNIKADVVYGLPGQTDRTIAATLEQVLSLGTDRVVLQGYAHMPWQARRQMLIAAKHLPMAEERLDLFETARRLLLWDGFVPLGIDHFVLPGDALAKSAATGQLRRDMLGYCASPSPLQIGIGASSVWHLPQGFAQNHTSTSQHLQAVRAKTLPVARGFALSDEDQLRGRAIEMILCDLALNRATLLSELPKQRALIDQLIAEIAQKFPEAIIADKHGFSILPAARPAARLIAAQFDAYWPKRQGYSWAV